MAEDEETKEAVETLAAEADALHHAHHGDQGVGHGSIAPAAHVKPVASARTRTSDLSEALAGKARETHGHPVRDSIAPSASKNAAAAASMPAVLRDKCVEMTHDWWTYQLCFGKTIRQYHANSARTCRRRTTSAHWAITSPRVAPARLQRYRGGSQCAVGATTRSAEVKLECKDVVSEVVLSDVQEPHTCHYLLTVDVPEEGCRELEGGRRALAAAAGVAAAEASAAAAASAGGDSSSSSSESRVSRRPPRWEQPTPAAAAAASEPATTVASSTAESTSDGSSLPPSQPVVVPFDRTLRELPLEELRAMDPSGTSNIPAKRLAIIHGLRHAWKGYAEKAFGQDELKPLSGRSNNWIGLGLTILDSLDVLWLAGTARRVQARFRLGAFLSQL